jgi:hypothetical protein
MRLTSLTAIGRSSALRLAGILASLHACSTEQQGSGSQADSALTTVRQPAVAESTVAPDSADAVRIAAHSIRAGAERVITSLSASNEAIRVCYCARTS